MSLALLWLLLSACAPKRRAVQAPPPMAPAPVMNPQPPLQGPPMVAPPPTYGMPESPPGLLAPPPAAGAIFFPCQADSQCMAHRCDVARGQCAWPCQAHSDCQPGFQCISPACVPAMLPH